MTSAENFGPQFKDHILVHRGYSSTPTPDHIDFNRLGHHWTTDKSVAESFAIQDTDHPEEGFPLEGTVLTGLIHKDHVMASHEIPNSFGVLQNGAEFEQTIREGAPVKVIGANSLKLGVEDTGIHREKYIPSQTEGKA